MKVIILLSLVFAIYSYNRGSAQNYAATFWNNPNHSCGSYSSCSPYSYWGGEHCGYESHGGDCANFVSQCLLAGGHAALVGGYCRGYPCGVEEIGAMELSKCLRETFGYSRTCGYHAGPPGNIEVGDVLIYHKDSCEGWSAHATIVV